MAIKLERIGHCALRVRDLKRSMKFYIDVLGFELVEQDPEHGGVFLSLPGDAHTIDLDAFDEVASLNGPQEAENEAGLVHIAFKVTNYSDLKEAYETLKINGVEDLQLFDHVSQRSIYFDDPDGNGLEIYCESPDAREIFRRGRGDQDLPFSFDDPPPIWADSST
jgi:catechol 2,3-dioxygenase